MSEPPARTVQPRPAGHTDQPAEAPVAAEARRKRVAILHAGGLAPGMNTAARTAVRIGLDAGWTILGVQGGFHGLMNDEIRELAWSDVEGWVGEGGAELGTRREVPSTDQLYALGRGIEKHQIDALIAVGGYSAYEGVYRMYQERDRYPAFCIPIILVPCTIDNNLPGSELAIGADTALNNAVWALDRIKQSASASTRCFVAETMGRKCGYLALMSGLASGAERVYLHEEGVSLAKLADDVEVMKESFRQGRKLFLVIRNEEASAQYTTDFLARLFEEEGKELFDVRQAIMGHLQQGGSPSPFDRLLATRLMWFVMKEIAAQLTEGKANAEYIGMTEGQLRTSPVAHMMEHVDVPNRRPSEQWWMQLRPVITAVAEPHAKPDEKSIPVLRAE